MNCYKKLMSPVPVGNFVLKDRLIYTDSLPNKLQGPERYPSDNFRAYFSQMAKAAAIVTMAEWNFPHSRKFPMGLAHQPVLDQSDPSHANYYSMLADDVHFEGSKIIISMKHQFPEGYSEDGKIPFPSNFLYVGKPKSEWPVYKLLPAERMHEVVEKTVERVGWYLSLGFDGFTMRCDLSLHKDPIDRHDQYDHTTLENRTRLVVETYKALREAYGRDIILETIVAWEQPYGYGGTGNCGNGSTEAEVLEYLKLVDPYVDIVQVREPDVCRAHPIGFNFTDGVHPAVDACERFKKAGIKALLAPVGGFQNPEEMENILRTGKCDMFAGARMFIADYDFACKLDEGLGEDIVPCILCNKCHGTAQYTREENLNVCSVNPRHGVEHYKGRLIKPETKPQRIAVIGGGAAGMRAAVIAAGRGHAVTLYEKSAKLGGQLLHSEVYGFKWPIKRYKDWMIGQLGKLGVDVRLNCKPSKDEIIAGGYDAVIAATGAVASIPSNIEGLVDANGNALYPTCHDVFMKQPGLGRHVVIIGGSETGIETAIYLLDHGHDVTMLTRQKEIGETIEVPMHYIKMAYITEDKDGVYHESAAWEIYENFKGITEATTKSVKDNAVTYVDKEGKEHTIQADSVVICGGVKALTEDALEYQMTGRKFFVIGDCNHAGNIQKCNRQAYAAAMRI